MYLPFKHSRSFAVSGGDYDTRMCSLLQQADLSARRPCDPHFNHIFAEKCQIDIVLCAKKLIATQAISDTALSGKCTTVMLTPDALAFTTCFHLAIILAVLPSI